MSEKACMKQSDDVHAQRHLLFNLAFILTIYLDI